MEVDDSVLDDDALLDIDDVGFAEDISALRGALPGSGRTQLCFVCGHGHVEVEKGKFDGRRVSTSLRVLFFMVLPRACGQPFRQCAASMLRYRMRVHVRAQEGVFP